MTAPELSETQSISHPQISQIYDIPSSAFCAFFVLTTFFDFGFSAFDSVFMAIIFPLSFHHEEAVDPVDCSFFGICLPPLNIRLIVMIFIHIVKVESNFLEYAEREFYSEES